MKYDIFLVSGVYRKEDPITIENVGYIENDKFDKEEFFNLCNWSGYSDTKPTNLYADLISADSNIVFYNPEDQKYYIPKFIGWEEPVEDFRDVESIFCLRKVQICGLKSGDTMSILTK